MNKANNLGRQDIDGRRNVSVCGGLRFRFHFLVFGTFGVPIKTISMIFLVFVLGRKALFSGFGAPGLASATPGPNFLFPFEAEQRVNPNDFHSQHQGAFLVTFQKPPQINMFASVLNTLVLNN